MKKTLLAAALALGFTGVAQAETSVTLYGIIDAGFGYHQQKGKVKNVNPASASYGATQTVKRTRTGLHDGADNGQSGSRFGLRGTEDLGNGLRAEFLLEQGFNIGTGGWHDSTGKRQFSRQAWIGLASDSWGSLRFGRQHNIGSDFLLGMIDPFGGSFGIANGAQAFTSISTFRMDNAVRYVTPNFSGFQFGLAYSFNHTDEQGWKHEEKPNENTRAISTGIRYANGPLGVGLSYDQMKRAANTGFKDTTVRQWVLGAAYDFEVVKLSAAFGQGRNGTFRNTKQDPNSDLDFGGGDWEAVGNGVNHFDKGFKSNSYLVGLTAPVGAGTVMLSWAMMDPRSNPDRFTGGEAKLEKQTQYALGYTYDLSKRTNVYAYGAYMDNIGFIDDNKATSIAIGLRHRF